VFRSYLISEEEINQKINEFQQNNEDLSKIFRLENPELAEDTDESHKSIKKMILPPWYEKSKLCFENLDKSTADEILEKYVILSYLVDDTFLKHLKFEVNYFEKTIFKDFFKDISNEEILQKIEKIDKKYKKLFDKLQNWEMQRILRLPYVGHRADSKKIDFKKKAHEFLLDKRKVKYLHSVLDEEKQVMTLFKLYYKEIEKMVFAEFSDNKIHYSTLMDFQQFSEGKFTTKNVSTFKRYFIKVNAQHGLMNLPSSFKNSRNIYGN
jgi:hypothetical protein